MAKEIAKRRNLVPVAIKWDQEGRTVQGRLVSKEYTVFDDNTRGRYMLETTDGLVTFWGCYQIDRALGLVEEGTIIGLTYLGEEGSGKGHRMKMFDIWEESDSNLFPWPSEVSGSASA